MLLDPRIAREHAPAEPTFPAAWCAQVVGQEAPQAVDLFEDELVLEIRWGCRVDHHLSQCRFLRQDNL
jgi:hypothetical protein